MTQKFAKESSSTRPVAPPPSRQDAVREQARREIPELRKQAEEGIATLRRLADRASS
jgi:hypothetical protein